MAEDTQPTQERPSSNYKMPLKTLIILLLVFLIEGGTISLFFVMRGGPNPAEGTDPIEDTQTTQQNKYAEVVLVQDFQVDNYMAGRTRMIVTLEVAAKVELTNKEKLDQNVSEHSKEILNSVRILVSSAQPDQIKDPKLEVVKRKIKSGVEEIVGEGLIEEVLLPVWQVFISD